MSHPDRPVEAHNFNDLANPLPKFPESSIICSPPATPSTTPNKPCDLIKNTDLRQPFVIAIAGPSSSGKTTLAYLLRAILQPFTRDDLASQSFVPESETKSFQPSRPSTSVPTSSWSTSSWSSSSGSATDEVTTSASASSGSNTPALSLWSLSQSGASSSGSLSSSQDISNMLSESISTSFPFFSQAASPRIPVIHQDTFFEPKYRCPRTTYVTTERDRVFVEETVRQARWMNGRGDCGVSEDGKGTNIRLSVGEEIVVEDGFVIRLLDPGSGTYEVTGPDTDCVDSVDWEAFEKCVHSLLWERNQLVTEKGRVKLREAEPETWERVWWHKEKLRESKEGPGSCAVEEQHKRLVEDMRERVEKTLSGLECGRDRAREKTDDVNATASRRQRFDREIAIVEGFQLYPPRSVNPSTSISATAIQSSLLPLYTLPLFLALPRAEMKARRFARAAYVDEKEGGLRRRGEMWKTEGYFDRVVAMGENENAIRSTWEIEGNEGQGKLTVCVGDGRRDMREVVEWALDRILNALMRKE